MVFLLDAVSVEDHKETVENQAKTYELISQVTAEDLHTTLRDNDEVFDLRDADASFQQELLETFATAQDTSSTQQTDTIPTPLITPDTTPKEGQGPLTGDQLLRLDPVFQQDSQETESQEIPQDFEEIPFTRTDLDTIPKEEFIELHDVDIHYNESQYVLIDGSRYEIGLTQDGVLCLRNNGTVYLAHYVQATDVKALFKGVSFFSSDTSQINKLRNEGLPLVNISRFYTHESLDKKENKQPSFHMDYIYTDKENNDTTIYSGILIAEELVKLFVEAVQKDKSSFIIKKEVVKGLVADAKAAEFDISRWKMQGLKTINEGEVTIKKISFPVKKSDEHDDQSVQAENSRS